MTRGRPPMYLGWPIGTMQAFVASSPGSPELAAAAYRMAAAAPPLPPDAIDRLRVLLAPGPTERAQAQARLDAWETAHRRHRKGTRWTICPGLARPPDVVR